MQVRIVEFSTFALHKTERTLEELLNKGWRIVAGGGGGSVPWYMVVLQREEPMPGFQPPAPVTERLP